MRQRFRICVFLAYKKDASEKYKIELWAVSAGCEANRQINVFSFTHYAQLRISQ